MILNEYKVTLLTSKNIEHTYITNALNTEQAVILAQAEAIKNGRGYQLVSCHELNFYYYSIFE